MAKKPKEEKKLFSVRLAADLLVRAKHKAIDLNISLQEMVTRALEEYLRKWTK